MVNRVLASLVAQMVKNSPAMWETWVQSLSWEDPLEEDMATHPSILAWRIPMDRGLWAPVQGVGGLQSYSPLWVGYSPWGCKESDMNKQLSMAWCIEGMW